MRRLTLGMLVALAWASTARAGESPAAWIQRGNAALKAGKHDEALKAYEEAAVGLPESPELDYNRGLVHYRLRDFVKARECFTKSLSTRDLKLESAAHFNLGNCAYSQALEKLSRYDEAIKLAREAIGHYRQALDLAPNDADARANIETARLLIKDLQDKKKKEQEKKKPESQPSSQPQSQPSSRPESQPSSQPRSQPSSQPDQQRQKSDQQAQQKKEQQSKDGQKQEKQKQSGTQPQKISREEAQRLLQAVRDKERKRRRDQMLRRAAGRVGVDKDW